MKIWKLSIALCFKTIVSLYILLSISVSAQTVELLELKTGVWEGIISKYLQYNILELNDDGNHRFSKVHILSGSSNVLNFTDEQIICTISECIINITEENNEITRLIISPMLETSFNVLQINADPVGKPIITEIYQLDQVIGVPTVVLVSHFIKTNRDRLESLKNIRSDDVYGFWLGVLIKDDKPELLTFEVHPETESYFTLFSNGNKDILRVPFDPKNIKVDQDVIYIDTEHPTFANKLIVHQLKKDMLSGYMYSLHKGHTLQTAKFSLMRME
jgi:hypothetical protein